ncbi:MAG TPA: RDD family protein [Blastocatellia bacterium]|nr:RDD family protein [Blastocatellia bacterium]
MSYGGNQPPGYPPSDYPPGYPPPGYPQPGGYQPGGYQPGGYPPGGYGAMPAPHYASIGKRFGAWFCDALIGFVATIPGWVVFGIAIAIGAANADSQGRVRDSEAGAFIGLMFLGYGLLFLGLMAVGIYNIYLLGKTGSTLGKRWMKIRVLDPSGQPLGFWKAFARELVKGLIGNVCFILWLWPLWDEQKQGLYDKVFNTHVYEA